MTLIRVHHLFLRPISSCSAVPKSNNRVLVARNNQISTRSVQRGRYFMIRKNWLFNHKSFININYLNRMVLATSDQVDIILPAKSTDSAVYLNALRRFKFRCFNFLSFKFALGLWTEVGETFFRKIPDLNARKLFFFCFHISPNKISWSRCENFICNWILSQNIPTINLIRQVLSYRSYHLDFVFLAYFENFEIRIWLLTTWNNKFSTFENFTF